MEMWASLSKKGDFEYFFLCSLVLVVTDGVADTAAKWSRDTTFLGSAMSTTVHCCLVCCVDGSEGRWKEVHGVWWGEVASAKPMGGKTIQTQQVVGPILFASSPGWRAHSSPTGLKCTEQPLAQPSHPTVTLNISTTWPSHNAHTADPRTNDADIRHKVCDQVQHKRVAAELIPSHRLETEACNAQEREQIRRNGEVDLLSKMATCLPVPDYDPRRPDDIAMCGGPAPTPARKWILQRRRFVTFDGGTMARYGNGLVEQGVGSRPTPCILPSHTTIPMGPHPPNTAGRPQGACGLAPVPRPTWRMPTARPTHHAPPVTHRCRPRYSQRCRHGTQSSAHELYDRTPRTLSSAIK